MNHKVFRSVFVLAVALGLAGVMVRIKDAPEVRPSILTAAPVDPDARPLACYRVAEEKVEGGADYRGAVYRSRVAETGFTFAAVPEENSRNTAPQFTVEFGAPRLEQGSLRLECSKGRYQSPAFGVGQVDRGAVVEEYLFENRRVEQIFRIPVAVGEGALRVCIPVKSDLDGPVVVHDPKTEGFKEIQFAQGGLAFCDAAGTTKLAYHSAVAIDADGRRIALAPRHERGEIVLEVPAEFMAIATYPLVVDPWLDLAGSGSGGGISKNASASQRPALAKSGDLVLAWSDNSSGNFDIYVTTWNGFSFVAYDNSLSPGGISANGGRSVNPTLALDGSGSPSVAWEDDSGGAISIYCKQWPARGQGTTWLSLGAFSASGTGVSGTGGPSVHPSIGVLAGVIPGVVTTNPATGITTSTPPKAASCPVIAWEEMGLGSIYCAAFYPGAPAQPVSATNPQGLPTVPAGWYQLGTTDGLAVDSTLFFPFATVDIGFGLAQHPSLVVDGNNRVCVTWQDTRDGNYEIYFRRWAYNVATGFQNFEVRARQNLINFDIIPAANFRDIAGATGTTGRITTTLNPSQLPNMALDGIANYTIAWQETESAVAPAPPATSSQIYLLRSTGAAFAAVGGSTAPGGISRTGTVYGSLLPGNASTPSVDVGGNYIGVAWADDSNLRSSIYVRRFAIVGGAAWEQVGFQGSAFPPFFVGESAPIGGVSQTSNFAFQPQIAMRGDGSPTVAWADGSGASFDIMLRQFHGNAPGVASGVGTINPTFSVGLTQTTTDPRILVPAAVPVTIGGFSTGTTVFLSSRVFTETVAPATTTLRIEFEIQPAGAAFSGTPTHQTLFVAPDNPTVQPANLAVLQFDGLPNFNYHWIARTIDQIGRPSPWLSPGEVGGVSFRINAGAAGGGGPPNTTPVAGSGSTPSKGSCGLTGLEAIALLGALSLVRRRRK